jgi:hypothetical protein
MGQELMLKVPLMNIFVDAKTEVAREALLEATREFAWGRSVEALQNHRKSMDNYGVIEIIDALPMLLKGI